MKANLTMMRDAIEQIDSDPVRSLYFYNNPEAKPKFLYDILSFTIAQIDNIHDPVSQHKRYNEILDFLNMHYDQYAWAAHEVHFHTSFMQHAACTFTCLNEISTIIEKLIKEKFAA